jgi:hypothetical protein
MSASPTDSAASQRSVAIVTGGSAGLGWQIAATLLAAGYRVAIVGRSAERLEHASERLRAQVPGGEVLCCEADLSNLAAAQSVVAAVIDRWARIDVLVNNIGQSDRGVVSELEPDHLMQRIAANVVPTLCLSRTALPHLQQRGGVIINIGSLAAKVGARYLGAYPAAKHALAGLTQQMRLEWAERGVHVGLLNPGPIRREDAGTRYAGQIEAAGDELPAHARQPGGGTTVKGLDPQRVAIAVLTMIRRRQADRMLPGYLRPLVAIGHLWPPLGDWLLLRFTRGK